MPIPVRESVLSLRDNPNSQTVYVVKATLDSKGKPVVKRLANVYILKSASNLRVKVGVQSWENDDVSWYYGAAVGGGYDKISAALSGCVFHGHKLNDGDKTLASVAYENEWTILGDL